MKTKTEDQIIVSLRYLQNDEHIEKRKKIVPFNRNYAALLHLRKK